MAFSWFASRNVDVAVIEVGLGGRLDCTNIITPVLSVITNISLDHTALLGDSEELIASEKAGIIKPGIPVVIGAAEGGVRRVFEEKAASVSAPIIFAANQNLYDQAIINNNGIDYKGTEWGDFKGELCGDCQRENAATVLASLDILKKHFPAINSAAVAKGFRTCMRANRPCRALDGNMPQPCKGTMRYRPQYRRLALARPGTYTLGMLGNVAYGTRFCQRQGCDSYHGTDATPRPLLFCHTECCPRPRSLVDSRNCKDSRTRRQCIPICCRCICSSKVSGGRRRYDFCRRKHLRRRRPAG